MPYPCKKQHKKVAGIEYFQSHSGKFTQQSPSDSMHLDVALDAGWHQKTDHDPLSIGLT